MRKLSERDKKFASGDSGLARETQRYIRSALLLSYASATRTIGIDPYSMVRRVGMPQQVLEEPDLHISSDKFLALIERTAEAGETADFGLRVGAGFELAMMGPIGLLMREQETVRAAIDALGRYMRYQNNTLDVRLEDDPGGAVLIPHLFGTRLRQSPQLIDLTAALLVRMLKDLLGEEWRPAKVSLRHAPPADIEPFRTFFGEVVFGADLDGIWLTRADLEHRQPNANPLMARQIAKLIEQNAPKSRQGLADRVEQLIEALLPSGNLSIDQVARHLGVDRRTVHRKLQLEGVSFTELVDQARRSLVASELANRDEPLAVLAHRLGFSSLSTFSRWFRQAYGMRASDFRDLASC